MAPRKRISKVISRETTTIVQVNDNDTRSISSQTDPLKAGMLRTPVPKRRLIRPRIELLAASKVIPSALISDVSDEQQKRNKSTQTLKTGLGPTVVKQNQVIDGQMDSLKALVKKRRADAIDWDHARIEELKDKINADPPPSWHAASQMWLEIDRLKERVNAHNSDDANRDGDDENNNNNNNDDESYYID